MGDLLRQGSQWLEQMRTAHCSSPVEYRPAPTPGVTPTTFIVNATFGRTNYEIADETGLSIGAHVHDFLIMAEELRDLLPGGPGGEPSTGDLIVANGRKYEVLPLGEDVRGWRWSDAFGETFRIHTRDIGPAE